MMQLKAEEEKLKAEILNDKDFAKAARDDFETGYDEWINVDLNADNQKNGKESLKFSGGKYVVKVNKLGGYKVKSGRLQMLNKRYSPRGK